MLAPALLGAVALVVLVVAAGRAPVPVGVELPVSFHGLLRPASRGGTASAVLVLLALGALVMSWWALLSAARCGAAALRRLTGVAALWLVPLVLGPPLISMDAYAYLAQGRMLATGLDPYAGGPVLLGGVPDAARVDPMWRSTPVPYGPLSLVLLRAVAVLTEDLTLGVLLLRLLACAGVAVAVAAALSLAAEERRPVVLVLTLLNPVTLVHLVGGAHLDGVLAGVVALFLLAVVRRRRWTAWTLAAAAVAVKASAGPLLLFALVDLRRSGVPWARLLPASLGLGVLPWLAALWAVERPWAFAPALLVPGSTASWYAPSSWAGSLAAVVGGVLGVDEQTARAAGRLAVLLAGAAYVVRAALSVAGPDDDGRQGRVRSASAALVVAALCLPALYGWYLAAGLFGLAAVARGRSLIALIGLSSALAFTSLPPLYDVERWPLISCWFVLLPSMAVLGARLLRRAPRPTAGQGPRGALVRSRPAVVLGPGAVVLLTAFGVGLLAPQATAGPARPQLTTVTERARVVQQLEDDYPGLQVGEVVAGGPGGPAYRVQLVRPGIDVCELALARSVGPLARLVRLPDATRGRTLRAVEETSCPPPRRRPR